MNTSIQTTNDAQMMEGVLVGGDLSKLSPAQRLAYYQKVCESIGLNPLTKPFSYITLKGKLTLYALKDATDQLRKIHSVSIVDVDIVETEQQFIVKVKGQDKTGRTDMEVGVVNKGDMQGDSANVQMKAVTKAKRRLTLSMCGLGWLDETEVQTIPNVSHVPVDDSGEIIDASATKNPDPIDDGAWGKWVALCQRAEKVNVDYPEVNRETTTKSDLRAGYIELQAFVEQAEYQAEAA